MPTESPSVTPRSLYRLAQRHRWLLFGPAIAGAVLAAAYTMVAPRDWSAEQGLLIRSDAAGYSEQRLGKFTDLAEMKTVQETLLELARSQSVIGAALKEVGPPGFSLFGSGGYPSAQDIDDFRGKIRLTPPGGAEFGKTEVFYLSVRDKRKARAVELVGAVTAQLELKLRQLRDRRATGLVAEVERSVAVAREHLGRHVGELAAFEQSIGAELVELRRLTNPSGGQSEFSQMALAIEAERRRLAEGRQRNEMLLVELEAAVSDPSKLVATPDALLTSQPALARLKIGLVDAQLAGARIAGARTAQHPFVLAAKRSQERVQEELLRELPTAIAGVKLEQQLAVKREAELDADLEHLRNRAADLASQRSRYTELLANVEAQTRVLEKALQQLADAQSHQAGAASASLLARIDRIEAGVRPVGPSRKAVTAAGGLAGLILGASLVWVLYGPSLEGQSPTPKRLQPAFTTATTWAAPTESAEAVAVAAAPVSVGPPIDSGSPQVGV